MTRVEQIKARLAAATPGPWGPVHRQQGGMIIDAPERWVDIGRHQEARLARSLASRVDADAELIANAPADLEWLVDCLAKREADLQVMRMTYALLFNVGREDRELFIACLHEAIQEREVAYGFAVPVPESVSQEGGQP